MKFVFTEKKYHATDELKAFAEKKLSKLDKFFRNEPDAYVMFVSEGGREKLEVTVKSNGMTFRYSDTTVNMHDAISAAVASIDRQIRKNRTRLEKRLRSGAFAPTVLDEELDAEVQEEQEFEIVRTKRFSLKPMTTEEAILQMNLLGHEFFAFINEDANENFSVVYRRRSGGYGLIENGE